MKLSTEWNSPQQEVIEKGIFKEKNLVLCWPTGDGKTHIIIEAMIKLAKHDKKSLLLLSKKTAVKEKMVKKIHYQLGGRTLDFECGAVFGGNVYKLIRSDKYLFSWDSFSGADSKKLLEFLRSDFNIDWAENAEISKLNNVISISKDGNSAEIRMDKKQKKAILKVSDVRSYNLKVKRENGQLTIYGDKLDLKMSRRDVLQHCKMIVGTYESIDKILRKDEKILSDLRLIAADEIHNLANSSRGATVDKVVTLLRHLNQKAQVILSSASLGDVPKLAKWINGEPHIYTIRTVPIRICFYCFEHKKFEWLDGNSTPNILRPLNASNKRDFFNLLGGIVSKRRKQCLIFQGTRQKSMAYAWSYTKYRESKSDEKTHLPPIERMISTKTGCDNAGMISEDRDNISNAYLNKDKEKRITSIHCTSTHAESFDSQTSFVVISDIVFAKNEVSSIDLEQMIGRIREPFIDSNGEKYGIGVVLIKKHEDKKLVEEKLGKKLEIVSKLEDKEKFSEQMLSLIGQYNLSVTKEILKESFFGVTSSNKLNQYFQDTIDMLKKQGFLDSYGHLTTLGKETNKFFIPVPTAKAFYDKKDVFESNLTENSCLEKIIEELSSVPEIKSAFRYKDTDNLKSFILLYCYTVPPAKLCKTFGISLPDFAILMRSIGRYMNFLQRITTNNNIKRWQKSIKMGVPPNFSDRFPSKFSLRSKYHLDFRKAVKKSIQGGVYDFNIKYMQCLRDKPVWEYLFEYNAITYSEDIRFNEFYDNFNELDDDFSVFTDDLYTYEFADDISKEFKEYLEKCAKYDVKTIGYNDYEVAGGDFVFRFNQEGLVLKFRIVGESQVKEKIHELVSSFIEIRENPLLPS